MTARAWVPDTALLGFEATTLPLERADDGEMVATLVRGMCDAPSRCAVLYLHGFADYFFQSHVADALNESGWDFYALDLRRYGRSLRPGQRPNFCLDLAEYDAELGAAIDIVRREEGHDTLVLLGHSTGGLVASLYAHRGARRAAVDGVVLNSPFFGFAVPFPHSMLLSIGGTVGAVAPWIADPRGLSPRYAESLLAEHHGEWTYDTRWKPVRGFPVYYGWLRAIRKAHAQVRRGLGVQCPVLLMHSSGSMSGVGAWDDAFLSHDIVLAVSDMKAVGPRLGGDVTLEEIEGGLHDLFLSALPARTAAIEKVIAWLASRFPAAQPTGVPE